MKKTILIILVCLIAASLFALTMMYKKTTTVVGSFGKGFAVLELFTSQGCSSCPPADELLGIYAKLNDDRIIPVAFHVDYWNRLGWKDSLSSHQFSARQSLYNSTYLHAGVYTPQLVINGETQTVGSDANGVKKAIDAALNESPSAIITVKNIFVNNGKLVVEYSIAGTSVNYSNLIVLVVQHRITTAVRAGENNGATLINYNVVRTLNSFSAKESGSCLLDLPVGIGLKELSLVLFTQDGDSGKITGAVKKDL